MTVDASLLYMRRIAQGTANTSFGIRTKFGSVLLRKRPKRMGMQLPLSWRPGSKKSNSNLVNALIVALHAAVPETGSLAGCYVVRCNGFKKWDASGRRTCWFVKRFDGDLDQFPSFLKWKRSKMLGNLKWQFSNSRWHVRRSPKKPAAACASHFVHLLGTVLNPYLFEKEMKIHIQVCFLIQMYVSTSLFVYVYIYIY